MGSTQHEGVDDDDDDEGEPERFNIAAVHGGGEDNAGRRDDNAIGVAAERVFHVSSLTLGYWRDWAL